MFWPDIVWLGGVGGGCGCKGCCGNFSISRGLRLFSWFLGNVAGY